MSREISKETIDKFSKWLDDKIVLRGIAEKVDGFVIELLLNVVVNAFEEKIPDEIEVSIDSILDMIADDNYDGAADALAQLLADVVPTPIIDGTPMEKQAYYLVIKAILAFIFKGEQVPVELAMVGGIVTPANNA